MSENIIDPISGQHLSMPHLVGAIHAGGLFGGAHDFDAALGVLLLKTGMVKFTHLMYGVESQDAGVLQFFEAPAISVVGTQLTLFNHKRTNTDTVDTTLHHSPTIAGNGTALPSNTIGSGGFPFRAGGSSDVANKYILKQNTRYLIIFTPAASAKFTMFVDLEEVDTNPDS